MRSWLLGTGLLLAMAAGATTLEAQRAGPAMRFKNMDSNGDGRITRNEWRGSDRSFQVHDWNGDGVLSGAEVRQGGQRQPPAWDEVDFDSAVRDYEFDDWTVRGFQSLDHNRDNRITADEWHFDREGFRRADYNRDGVISRAEFLNETAVDDDRDDRFRYLDVNRDGRISRAEWHGTADRFDVLDDDRNGYLTAAEMFGNAAPPELFASVDVNRDGWIELNEWHWSRQTFDQRDVNHDGRLSRGEFTGTEPAANRNQTYRAGYDRGIVEGRQAGKEDRTLRNSWDLEGQRELEQADSGYQPGMGARTDYQAGYREGFRIGYREGFGK